MVTPVTVRYTTALTNAYAIIDEAFCNVVSHEDPVSVSPIVPVKLRTLWGAISAKIMTFYNDGPFSFDSNIPLIKSTFCTHIVYFNSHFICADYMFG